MNFLKYWMPTIWEDDGILHDVNRRILIDESYDGKKCFDSGDFKGAIRHLEKVYAQDDTMYSAINNLALAYFF